MEKLSEQLNNDLSHVLLKNTGFYDTTNSLYYVLRRTDINTVADLLDESKLMNALSHCREEAGAGIKFLVSMVKYKYLGIDLPNKAYLFKKVNLKETEYFLFEDGKKINVWDFYPSSKSYKKSYNLYRMFARIKGENYLNGMAPFIDYLKYLYKSYEPSNRKCTFNNGIEITKAYIDSYNGNKSPDIRANAKLAGDYKDQLIILKKQLSDLNKLRNDLDTQIIKIQYQIEQVSEQYEHYTEKVMKKN